MFSTPDYTDHDGYLCLELRVELKKNESPSFLSSFATMTRNTSDQKQKGSKRTNQNKNNSPVKISTIKGYLPLRLHFPPAFSPLDPTTSFRDSNATFLYLKEHQTASVSAKNKTITSPEDETASGTTIFVANAPMVAGISTTLLLQAIFGRYGDVQRVTVVPNPRRNQNPSSVKESLSKGDSSSYGWSSRFASPSFLGLTQRTTTQEGGKFAHIVMATRKDLRRALSQVAQVMGREMNMKDKGDETEVPSLPGLVLDPIELQTLADETQRQHESFSGMDIHEESSDDETNGNHQSLSTSTSALLNVVARYRRSKQPFLLSSHEDAFSMPLMEECNSVMQSWEEAEASRRLAREQAAQQPDDDGFVTVSYGSSSALTMPGEEDDDDDDEEGNDDEGGDDKDVTTDRPIKRRRRTRSRRKSSSTNSGTKISGAQPLTDFYRFQTKDNRKRTLQELRQRFEQDLAKVQQMKEDKKHCYRPFS